MDRIYSIDYFKCWAMFFIVCIHTAPFYGAELWGLDGRYLNFLINTFARFAVPFFFMSSGFLFVQKILSQKDDKIYFKKYIHKIFAIFGSWYIFYLIYDFLKMIMKVLVLDSSNIFKYVFSYFYSLIDLKNILSLFLYGDGAGVTSYHLWYLVALIWSISIVYLFLKKSRLNVLLCISLFLNIIGLLGQTYSGLFELKLFNYSLQTRDAIFFGLFYTTLGSWIAFNYEIIKYKINKMNYKIFIFLFCLFSFTQLIERTIAEVFWSSQIKSVDFYFSTVVLSISLLLFALKKSDLGRKSVLSRIGKNSVGIYVFHVFFIDFTISIFTFLEIDIKNYLSFHVIFTLLIFIVSIYFYKLLQTIKMKLKYLLKRKKEVFGQKNII